MSYFKGAEICEVESVEKHPNADSLDVVKLEGKDYTCVVQSARKWKPGRRGVYIPEQAVVPDSILDRIGLNGKLAGSKGNRVKAVKLRGIISQGLLLSLDEVVGEEKADDYYFTEYPDLGSDLSEQVGIYKYEPPIPVSMRGEVLNLFGQTIKYDIENIKNHPDILEDGEMVDITEKIHGTLVCFSYQPNLDNPELYNNKVVIYSKGLGAKGLVFKWNKQNENLLYHRAFKKIEKQFMNLASYYKNNQFFLFGEVFGTGVQDLSYGEKDISVRFFDMYVGHPGSGFWKSPKEKQNVFDGFLLPSVPVLYRGSFSKEVLSDYTEGKETVSGKQVSVREGVVITPHNERVHPSIGRVILKSINPSYLTRKGGTEYN